MASSGTLSPAGLCDGCRHASRVKTARGSVFLLCLLSRTDSRFPRYPRLPVLQCAGFQPADAGHQDAAGGPADDGPA